MNIVNSFLNFIKKNCLKIVIVLVVWFVFFAKYGNEYAILVMDNKIENCMESNLMCQAFLGMSGQYIAIVSFIFLVLFVLSIKREKVIKYLILYFSTISVLYTSGIVFADIEEQKTIVELNKIFYNLEGNKQLLLIYEDKKNKIETQKVKTKINVYGNTYLSLLEEKKLYYKIRLFASIAIIFLSITMLLILFIEYNMNDWKILITLSFIFIFVNAYPATLENRITKNQMELIKEKNINTKSSF